MREREEGERGGRRGKEEKEGIMEGRAVGKEGRKEEETAVQPERVLIPQDNPSKDYPTGEQAL